MSLLPVFPRLENLLGACLSHECVGSFLALFSCLNFNFLSAWAQLWELKHIELCPRGGKAPNSSSALSFVLAGELSASRSQEQWQCLKIHLLVFSYLHHSGTAGIHLVFILSLRLLNQGDGRSFLCEILWGFMRSWVAAVPIPLGAVSRIHHPVLWAGWAHAAAEAERS